MERVTHRSFLPAVGGAIALVIGLAGCGAFPNKAPAPKKPAIAFETNVSAGQSDVTVDTLVRVSSPNATVTKASLASAKTSVPVEQQGDAWVATSRLEPGTDYVLTAVGKAADGRSETLKRSFRTHALTLNEQTYPSVSPLASDTVGVAMPVIVRFDLPVKNRELFEQNMSVETSQPAEGRWAWFGDREVHYRTKDYWPANTDVTVKVLVNSLPAGNGIYGQQDQVVKFHVGRKVVGYVDVSRYTLTLKEDDRVVRSIPVSTGDSEHRTRFGTKVIMEKLRKVDMDAATTGVDSEDDDYYDLEDVEYAMRLTNSGEFLHAAPWSVASQGRANVSHGCTGMSTANAEWLYGRMKKGDPVEYTGSPRPIEPGNGWTDWNIDWDDWVKKSALKATPTPSATTPSAPTAPTSAVPTFTPSAAAPKPGTTTTLPNGIRITS